MVQHELQILLVHPGGPFWKNKDEGAWSIPKGEFGEEEQPLVAAIREFKEETGFGIDGNFLELTPLKQKSGKWIYAWAVEGNIEVADIISNEFEMEWPPKSGKLKNFTEIDRGGWFNVSAAKQKIVPGQVQFIEELVSCLKIKSDISMKGKAF